MRALLRSLGLAVGVSLLVACGFHLRGSYTLPFDSLYLAFADYDVVGANLKRQIRASGSTRIALTQSDAQASLLPGDQYRDRVILSVSGTGRVSELRLRYLFNYRITDDKGRDVVPPNRIEIIRDLTYDDSQILAKQQEETLLWRDMENDLVQQLLRRLAAARPVYPESQL